MEIVVALLHYLTRSDPDDCSRSVHKDNINAHSDIDGKCSKTHEESNTRDSRSKMNSDCLEVDVASLHFLSRTDPDDCSRSIHKDNVNTLSEIEAKCSETQEESCTRSRWSKMIWDYLEVNVASLHSLMRSDPDDCSRSVHKDNINTLSEIEAKCSETQKSSTRCRRNKMNRDYLEVDIASLHSLTRSEPVDCSRSVHKDNINTHSDIEGKCSEIQEESCTRSRRSKMSRDYLEVDVASLHALTRTDPDDCSRSIHKDNRNTHREIEEGQCSETQEESCTRCRRSKMNRDYLEVDAAWLHSLTRSDPDD